MLARKPKTIRCVQCGYLCTVELREHKFNAIPNWTLRYEQLYHELPLGSRTSKGRFKRYFATFPVCYRQAVELESEIDSHLEEAETLKEKYWESINQERSCHYFVQYIPGRSPLQHFERQESAQRTRKERIWNIAFLLIGVGLTLLTTWLTNLWG